MGIGNKLSILLNERDMTVTELARRVGTAPTTIYSIIQRNNKKVDIDVLIKIANVLGVKVDYFGSDDNPNEINTIAAHFDGEEYTEDELDEIRQYAEFVKSKRKP